MAHQGGTGVSRECDFLGKKEKRDDRGEVQNPLKTRDVICERHHEEKNSRVKT